MTTTRHQKVLIADDNRDAADTLAMVLDFFGYTTKVAYDGQAALDSAQEFQPDVAILDINMPSLDGFETARRLRGRRGSDRLLLVALTAMGSETARELTRGAGFNVHLTKPIAGDALLHVLEASLASGLGNRVEAAPASEGDGQG